MVGDQIDENNETVVLNITGVSGGEGAVESGSQAQTITITDDDTAGFTLAQTGGSTSVAEAGSTDTFTAVLNSKADRQCGIFMLLPVILEKPQFSPATLTFTTGNWNTAQTVTVTGVNDSIDDGNVNSTTTIAINTGSTADSTYDSVSSQTVTVTTADDDTAGFTVTQSGGSTSVAETGSTDTFTVVLNQNLQEM